MIGNFSICSKDVGINNCGHLKQGVHSESIEKFSACRNIYFFEIFRIRLSFDMSITPREQKRVLKFVNFKDVQKISKVLKIIDIYRS